MSRPKFVHFIFAKREEIRYALALKTLTHEVAVAETQIEWTDATWNPVAGCSVVSAGCTNCYAIEMARRLHAMSVEKYKGLTRRSGKRTVWTGMVREDYAALEIPLRWKKAKKIFVNSMSDLFHEAVTDAFILKVWDVMRQTPHHSYQILTKRPERMAALVRSKLADVLPNVWLGTSVENAEVVNRIDALREVPAAIRFISFEPLIGSVGEVDLTGIHWAIVGGESGRMARPIREEWIDEIYDRCLEFDTAFFFKQWGTWGADNKRRSKKANGREYRGRQWDEMPKEADLQLTTVMSAL
jgi:protein gp37